MENFAAEIESWVRIAKGGPGSGDTPGHEFNGNQYTDASGAIAGISKLRGLSGELKSIVDELNGKFYPQGFTLRAKPADKYDKDRMYGENSYSSFARYVTPEKLKETQSKLEGLADQVDSLVAGIRRSAAVHSDTSPTIDKFGGGEWKLGQDEVGKHFLEASKSLEALSDNLRGAASIMSHSANKAVLVKSPRPMADDGYPAFGSSEPKAFDAVKGEDVLSTKLAISRYSGHESSLGEQVDAISKLFDKSELSLSRAAIAIAKDPSKEPNEAKAASDSAKFESKSKEYTASADAMEKDIEAKYDAVKKDYDLDEDGRPIRYGPKHSEELDEYEEAKDKQDVVLSRAKVAAVSASNAYSVMAHFASQRGDTEAAKQAQEKASEMLKVARYSESRWPDAVNHYDDYDGE